MSKEEEVTSVSVPGISLSGKMVVGGVAGVIGTTCIFPIDLVKTRLQNQGGKRMYKGAADCFKQIIKSEGFIGLYRGLLPNLIGVTPEKAIKLAVNDEVRRYFTNAKTGEISVLHQIFAGASAGFCQVTATNPMEIVKIRLQVQGGGEASGVKRLSALGVISELGLRGLYRGASVTLLRDVPFSVLFFPTYATLKEYFVPASQSKGGISILPLFVAGAVAAAFAAASVTPADVIKTRIQAEASNARQYSGVLDCAKKVWVKEGFGAFWKGAIQRSAVQAPLFGITLMAFEFQKWWLGIL